MFEQAFKNVDDVLWKEAGCTTELDYTEQTSWLLFLKYLDGLEQDRADEAALEGKKYAYILQKQYRWDQLYPNLLKKQVNYRNYKFLTIQAHPHFVKILFPFIIITYRFFAFRHFAISTKKRNFAGNYRGTMFFPRSGFRPKPDEKIENKI